MTRNTVFANISEGLTLFLSIYLLSCLAFAQKEPPLPKDLPPYGTEKPSQTPSVKTTRLDNGLNLWLVSEPGFPKVALTVAVRGGLAADPAGQPGISELLSKTIDQGTHTRSAVQIAQEIQEAGGDLSASADKDSIELSTVILSSKLDPALRRSPTFCKMPLFPTPRLALLSATSPILWNSARLRLPSSPSALATRFCTVIIPIM